MRDFSLLIIGLLLIQINIVATQETRLDTATNSNRIYVDKYLYSPMGLYRISLERYSCSFNIDTLQQANNNNNNDSYADQKFKYAIKDIYVSPNYMNSCQFIQVFNGGLIADQKEIYFTANSRYNEFKFLIDDNGIYRFIGLGSSSILTSYNKPQNLNSAANFPFNFSKPNQPYTCIEDTRFETKYIQNKTQILTFCQFNISQHPKMQKSTINTNNWRFTVDGNKTLKITKIGKQNGKDISFMFNYGDIQVSPNGIKTANNTILLYSNISQFIIYPKCSRELNPFKLTENDGYLADMKYMKYQLPISVVIDRYWPVVTIYDANKYKIFQFSPASYKNQLLICPEQTFQFRGNCIPACPQPFYYEIWEKQNKCVAQCQFGVKPNSQRICKCAQDFSISNRNSSLIEKCDNKQNAKKYPFGCYCTNNTYFDSIFTHKCVQDKQCPLRTLPINGLCMKCPENCQVCSRDPLKLRFLKCEICRQGYSVQKGLCVNSCNKNSNFITSQCEQCNISHCLKCSTQFPGRCLQCSPAYALEQGLCKLKCSNDYKAVFIKEQFQTLCLKKNQNCQQLVPTFYPQFFGSSSPGLSCKRCKQSNQIIAGDSCLTQLSSCSSNMEQRTINNKSYCICKNINEVSISGRCFKPYEKLTDRMPFTSLCPIYSFFNQNTFSCQTCPPTCLTCIGNDCTSCPPEHFLHISPFGSKCRLINPVHLCHLSKGYLPNFKQIPNLCVHNVSVNSMKCSSENSNCLLCKKQNREYCILCNKYYFFYNNTCVDQCPLDHFPFGSVCILKQLNCQMASFLLQTIQQQLNLTTLFQSQGYRFYNDFWNLPGNDIYTYPFFSKTTQYDFEQDIDLKRQIKTILKNYKKVCVKCMKGYGIDIKTRRCVQCPPTCEKCHFVDSNTKGCIISQVKQQFQQDQRLCGHTGFYNPIKNTCQYSCQSDQKPAFQNGFMVCIRIQDDFQASEVLTIDGSYYQDPNGNQNNQNIVFLVFSKTLKNIELPNQKTFLTNFSQEINFQLRINSSRLLQKVSTQYEYTGRQFFQFIDAEQQLHLNLTRYLPYIQSDSGSFLSNSQYGISNQKSSQNAFRNSLAFIGYICSFAFIILHVIYIGNGVLYKIDNLLIFIQSLFFFCFNRLQVGNSLSQFYYGWIYANGGWFPNFLKYTIPQYYFQPTAPLTYKLITLDANLIRNAGYSFCIFGVFVILYAILLIFTLIITKICKKLEFLDRQIWKNSIIGVWEFLVVNILYWSIAELLYGFGGKAKNQPFYMANLIISIYFCVTIGVYTIIRFCYNKFGGLYMLKRIGVITVLAFSYEKQQYVAIILVIQFFFTILRIIAQKPETCLGYNIIIIQEISFTTAYVILFYVENANAVTILITLFICVWILIFIYQLLELYLDINKQFLQKIDSEKQAITQSPATNSIKNTDREVVSTQRKLRKL